MENSNPRAVSVLLIINQFVADSLETTFLKERAERVHRRAILVLYVSNLENDSTNNEILIVT